MVAPAASAPAIRARAELVRRRSLQGGWACVALGVLLPIIALGAVRVGWSWRKADGRGQLPLIAAGTVVFVGRLALWVTGVL